ncbi:hypothetical protein ROHU_027906 [Labeo rohita]|uniref:Uncharacterized protein n=1 Tax=Labeo rohita TaxID=84645 RepID=A0A498M934_LABRO|nr:hypothetical protein ROHU_027906 [Labeo rohita]
MNRFGYEPAVSRRSCHPVFVRPTCCDSVAPSAICHATPLHVHVCAAPVSQPPSSSPPGPARPDICLSASKLPGQTTGRSCEPRALILSADLLTRPGARRRGRAGPAGGVKT